MAEIIFTLLYIILPLAFLAVIIRFLKKKEWGIAITIFGGTLSAACYIFYLMFKETSGVKTSGVKISSIVEGGCIIDPNDILAELAEPMARYSLIFLVVAIVGVIITLIQHKVWQKWQRPSQ